MALSEAEARRSVERALTLCRKVAPGAELAFELSHSRSGNTRFARNEVSTAGEVEQQELWIQIAFGQRVASSRSSQLDDTSLQLAAARTARMARIAPEQPERMPLLGPQSYLKPKAAADPATRTANASLRAQAAGGAIERARAAELVIAGFLQHTHASVSIANSAGLWGHHELTRASFDCTARTPDGSGSGWAAGHSQRWADFDVAALASVAIDKAVRSRAPRRLDPGRYTVVMEPAAVAALLDVLNGALDARSADEGRSFFSKSGGNRLDEKLWPEHITLQSDPGDAALGPLPWSREHLPLTAASWIERGQLKRLARSRYWAQHTGQPALPEPIGLRLLGGESSPAELIRGVKRGVLITRFWYLNYLDPATLLSTGLTRDGTFLIENGEISAPVNNFRFNESPHTMLKNSDALGASGVAPDLDVRVPALRSHEFHLASVSEAV